MGRSPTLREYIDWTPFFRSWELAGNFPAILDDEIVGESARGLWADAQAMLNTRDRGGVADAQKGVVGLWPCRSARGTTCSSDPQPTAAEVQEVRMPMLRQQMKKREGRPNMCLADFVAAGGRLVWRLRGDRDPRDRRASGGFQGSSTTIIQDILLKALADRLAEAFAERLHHPRPH